MEGSGANFDPASDIADVAVIGGGAAGLLAGIAAARAGARTVVYERMKTPGKKIAISGGGRCNFTNTLNPRQFVRSFGDENAAFLGYALRAFSSADLLALLAAHGVEGVLERDCRLYTKSGRGGDVVDALVNELQKAGAVLQTAARVTEIKDGGARTYELCGDIGDAPFMRAARTVVICTGGLSYPATGATGDGYEFARAFGHEVTPLRAALVGLSVEESWAAELQGISWPDAEVTLWPAEQTRKPLSRERAEILFTHFGISGPAILDTSNAFVASNLPRALLLIDFFPDQSREKLDARLQARFRLYPKRGAARALEGLLPARLLEHLERELAAGCAAGQLPKAARQALLERLKATRLTVTGTRGIAHGEVTAGGVRWEEIDPATLQSRRARGVFFAGEVLDVAGRCGGFNLQAAFSTGFLAGRSAAELALAQLHPGA